MFISASIILSSLQTKRTPSPPVPSVLHPSAPFSCSSSVHLLCITSSRPLACASVSSFLGHIVVLFSILSSVPFVLQAAGAAGLAKGTQLLVIGQEGMEPRAWKAFHLEGRWDCGRDLSSGSDLGEKQATSTAELPGEGAGMWENNLRKGIGDGY